MIITSITLYLIFEIEKQIEKKFISKERLRGRVIESVNSRWIFKIFKYIIIGFISIEHELTIHSYSLQLIIIGSLLFISGIFLRLLAIKTLGKYWSFSVEYKHGHKLVKYGIYRYFKHPGYLGNIFFVGICFLYRSQYTSLLCLIFLSSFYLYRASLEKRLNTHLERKGQVLLKKIAKGPKKRFLWIYHY